MKTLLLLRTTIALLFLAVVIGASIPVAAQTPADATRTRISEALAKGDLVAADKLTSELQSSKAAAQAGLVNFEEIKACGFYPQESRLECALDIKQRAGYGGNVGQFGSYEFVYFCVDWNDDGIYSAAEAVGLGIVHMHDESDGQSPPWQYAVYRDIDPPGALTQPKWLRTAPGNPTATTSKGSTRRARAILQWSAAPQNCNSLPSPWGNVVNFRIRFDPTR